MANLAKAGGLLPVLQPFAALYVLILAVLGPLLTKESERIYDLCVTVVERTGRMVGRTTGSDADGVEIRPDGNAANKSANKSANEPG
jgi:CPA2 family monovalent cation:H+ antiporter-2